MPTLPRLPTLQTGAAPALTRPAPGPVPTPAARRRPARQRAAIAAWVNEGGAGEDVT
ncbi:hypothetical protein ABIC78_002838 [Novosphingobium sp. 1529]|uniref:hypothetical protein n=1 Tax=Novosphingobium sp. 1529 TaxID=3156424 RepID=UPI0014941030